MILQDQLEMCRIDIAYLERDLLTVHSHRRLWRSLVDAIAERTDDNVPRVWPDHYTMLYVSAQASAVRRLVRGTKDQISWSTLLRRIEREGGALTVDIVLQNAGGQGVPEPILQHEREMLEETWFDSTGLFRSQIAHEDRSRLLAACGKVIVLADRSIAHIYKPEPGVLGPTFNDLDSAINELTEIHRRYRRLITGVDFDPSSIALESGWTNVFESPLFDSAWTAEAATHQDPQA